ncbi:hypothetical protein [Antarcticimicrobium luteum]|uniref:hypothetical protein n=1 Tax=Antarcticimicrobium luteum TaxID=2547397 RepID=UPI00197D83DD|nr:hypothetical protein [Antarcticimicrobium luteum]
MHRPADTPRPPWRLTGRAPRKRDDVWTILADAGLWLGLSVDALLDHIETEPRTGR